MTRINPELSASTQSTRIDTIARAERAEAPTAPAQARTEPSPFQRVLDGVSAQLAQGERTMDRVAQAQRSGAPLDNGDLLKLQADVYRYNEVVDLSAKLVDRASNGVKTVIQGQ